MDLLPVKSSNIKAVGYNKKEQVLRIKFIDGGIYDFSPVSEYVFDRFIEAESLGKFFHANIKGQYTTKKFEEVEIKK